MKFFVIAENGIGDSIMMLPALRALAVEVASDIKILSNPQYSGNVLYEFSRNLIALEDDVRPEVKNQKILDCIEWADVVVVYSTWDIVNKLGICAYLENKMVFGYFSEYCNHLIRYDDRNMIDQYFSVASSFNKGISIGCYSYPLILPDFSQRYASVLYSAFSTETVLIGIHTHTKEEKMVSAECFVKTLEIIKNVHPNSVFILVDPIDTAFSESVEEDLVSLKGLDISIIMEFLKYISLIVCIDSCILHAADFRQIPMISFFPVTDVTNWGPRYSRSLVISERNLSIEDIQLRRGEITSFLELSLIDKSSRPYFFGSVQ